MGIDGIIVSSHGGRPVNSVLAAICAASRILTAQRAGTLKFPFYSGVGQVSELIEAMALGALGFMSVVLPSHSSSPWKTHANLYPHVCSRPPHAFGRENSVEHVIKTILVDLEVSMGLGGFRNLGEIQGRMREVLVGIGGGRRGM